MARTSKLILVLTLVLSGCGASTPESLPSTTTSTQPRESTTTTEAVEKSAMLDFSPIAGEWSGMLESLRAGTSSRSPIRISLEEEARRGSVVGSIEYLEGEEVTCFGTLSALRVDGLEYMLFAKNRGGECNTDRPGVQVRLLYNPEVDELNFRMTPDFGPFAATLERDE